MTDAEKQPLAEEDVTLETPEEGVEEAVCDVQEDAQETVAMWQEKAVRALAEMENLRKRTKKEMVDAREFAIASFAKEMLSVADSMERAIAAMPKDEEHKTMREGVEMVASQLTQVFNKFKIQKFVSMGEALDPNKHQAMMEVESDEPAGTIVQEMQAGYTIGDRLLRPAFVGTAKGKG